ncbi:MAG: ferrochelatase [Candidatus Dadabacteria bacterium]|nr:ferrochelatase [Candidatus Dadabacteria bacterium]NIQ14900.1 ferrochelatase [Candidatus Dadabacteria bacterium]
MPKEFDAIMMIGYGGPEKKDDIMPFLRNVSKGRPIPEERLAEVAHHYEIFDGKSPLNEYTFKQGNKLEKFLSEKGYNLPVYVGMRNWRPFINDSLSEINDKGYKNVIGLIMAAHQSDASWERYMRDVDEGCEELNIDLHFEYVRPIFDHPLFIEGSADKVKEKLNEIPKEKLDTTMLIFTAHSIPVRMAENSPYVEQFETSSKLVAESTGHPHWMTCYQSRSGSPRDPWLEPDICDVIPDLVQRGITDIVVQAIGFVCDHIEVLYDIGIEAQEVSDEVGIKLHRASTVNDDDKFIRALEDEVLKLINS